MQIVRLWCVAKLNPVYIQRHSMNENRGAIENICHIESSHIKSEKIVAKKTRSQQPSHCTSIFDVKILLKKNENTTALYSHIIVAFESRARF